MEDLESRIGENPIIQVVGELENPFQHDATTKYGITGLDLVRRTKGQEAFDQLVDMIIGNHLPTIEDRDKFVKYISNEHNWINGVLDSVILEYCREALQIEDIYRFVGRTVINPDFLHVTVGESLGIEFIYKSVAKLNPNFNSVIDLEFMEDESRVGSTVIRKRVKEEYRERLRTIFGDELYLEVMRNDDLLTQGVLEAIPKAVNGSYEFAEVVEEPHCESRGDEYCEYRLTWKSERGNEISQFNPKSLSSWVNVGYNVARGFLRGASTKMIHNLPSVKRLVDRLLAMEVEIQRSGEELTHANVRLESQVYETGQQRDLAQQALADLQQTQAQLIEAEKLATAGHLAFGVGHDQRNILARASQSITPLGRIVTDIIEYQRIYSEEGEQPASEYFERRQLGSRLQRVQTLSTNLRESITQALQNVQALEGYASEDGSDFYPIKIEDTLDKLLLDYKDRLEGVTVTTSYEPEEYEFSGNPLKLYGVYENLLINALEATTDAPEITITTSVQDTTLTTIIEDNGYGMAEEVRKQALDPFYTTKEQDSSRQRGLGLFNVHRLVQQHHGTIKIESQPEQFTRIIIEYNLS
tara:strand:+ start:10774 stop:12528 length:1755 start_codon:yes stop_codon:yes gene_type:complete